MATTIRELLVGIGVEVDAKELDKLDKKISAFKSNLKVLAGFAAGVSAALVGTVVSSTLAGNAAAKGAQRTGLLIDKYQQLKFATGQAGASQEQFEQALRFANAQLGQIARGSATAAENFASVGVAAHDSEGNLKTADQLLIDLANSLRGETNAALIGAKAARVFGEEAGPKLVPLLLQGEAGIRALMARAVALGGVIGPEQAKRSEAFLDKLDDLKTLAFGLRNAFTGALLPALNRFLDTMIEMQIETRAVIAGRLEVWAERLGRALDLLRKIGVHVNRTLKGFGSGATWVDVLAKAILGLGAVLAGATLFSGVAVLRQLFLLIQTIGVNAIRTWVVANALLLGQILLVVGAFAAAGLAIDDFLTFIRGGDSVIGRFLESIGLADDVRDVLVQFGREAKEAIQPLFDLLADLFDLQDEDSGTFLDNWITGMKTLKPFIETTVTGLRELLALYRQWQERNDNGGTSEEREVRHKQAERSAVGAALERRAGREGWSAAELSRRRIEAGIATDIEKRMGQATAAQGAPTSTSTDQSRHVSTGSTTVNFSNVPSQDQEGVARRVLAEQTRQVRANLVEGADL